MNRSINPRMVTLARESRGWTQGQLADRIKEYQAKVSKMEAGLLRPSDDVLKKLCTELDYPEGFFYQDDELYGVDTSILFHRKRVAIGARVLNQIHATVNIRRMHVMRLLRAAEIEPARPFPRFDIEEFNGPQEVAKAVRATWTLPRGPVQNVTRTIEDAGGIIIRCDFGTRLIDALSQWVPGLPPLFFVNGDLPGDRLRWSLTHELGHVVMHQIVTPNLETEADAFAAAFLMPADDIRPYFVGGVSAAKLANMKPHWKASIAALLKRASDLDAITERNARYIWMQLGKAGYRMREPAHLDVPVEQPQLLQEVIEIHTGKLGYSPKDLGSVINLNDHEVRTTYLASARTLRAVR